MASSADHEQTQSIKNLIAMIKRKSKDEDAASDIKFTSSGYEAPIASLTATSNANENRFEQMKTSVLTALFLHDIEQSQFHKVAEDVEKAIESSNGTATKSLYKDNIVIISTVFPPSDHCKIILTLGSDDRFMPDDLQGISSSSDQIIGIEPVGGRVRKAWVLARVLDLGDLESMENQMRCMVSSTSLALKEDIQIKIQYFYEDMDILHYPAAERVSIQAIVAGTHRGDILLGAHVDRIAEYSDDLNAIIDMLDQKGVAVAVTTLDNEVQAPIRLLSTGGGTWRYSSAAGDNASVPDIAADKRLALSLADQSFAAGTQTRKDATLRQAVSQCSQLVFFVKIGIAGENEWSPESQISVMKRTCGRTADLTITAPPRSLMNCTLKKHPLYVRIKNGMVREGAHVVVMNVGCLSQTRGLLDQIRDYIRKKNIDITVLMTKKTS